MIRRSQILKLAAAAALACAFAGASADEAFPSKPITFVVPYAAGGPADAFIRSISQALSERLKVPVVVDNKPGANGNIGSAAVANGRADGYTLLLGTSSTIAINPHLYGKAMPYDTVKDLQPVTLMHVMANVLVVNPQTPLEEPIAADRPLAEWTQLAAASPLPLAAGENMRGEHEFRAALDCGAFAVVQPDPGKWGGFSGCVPVAHQAIARGRMFCPHWLGGGIGLVASMHLKGAVGGAGYAEVDSNPNPLRVLLAGPHPQVVEGTVTLTGAPGLGVAPDLDAVREFRVDFH